jgi:DNA-binding response OmpR family regulator
LNRKKTLLLVDDDRKQLAARKLILELSGYEVFTAGDARRGMQLFESEAPDAVVLDYEMPVINGGMLARTIRRADDAVPIVMLSGSVSVPSSALTAVDSFIPKSTAPSFLVQTIEVLTQSSAQEAWA